MNYSLQQIMRVVCFECNVTEHQMTSKTRTAHLVDARIVYSIIALKDGCRLKQVADSLNRDHASIIHYKRIWEDKPSLTRELKAKYDTCMSVLNKSVTPHSNRSTQNILAALEDALRDISELNKRLIHSEHVLTGEYDRIKEMLNQSDN